MASWSKKKLKYCATFLLFCFYGQGTGLALNAPTASIERSQELIEKDRQLRNEIQMNNKVFIKKIIVQGNILPKKEIIDEINDSFKNHWLSKEDMDNLIDLIRQDCIKNGYPENSFKITYRVYKSTLKVRIEDK